MSQNDSHSGHPTLQIEGQAGRHFCFFPLQLSRKILQKKQRLADSEQQQTPEERPPSTPGHHRSIYFSSPEDHPARLGPEFFDQPAVTLARAFLGQVTQYKSRFRSCSPVPVGLISDLAFPVHA